MHITDGQAIDNGIVHIYAQDSHGMDAFIMGDEKGLISLRDAINEAIYPGKRLSQVDVFCNDGEGYTIKIQNYLSSSTIHILRLPYK